MIVRTGILAGVCVLAAALGAPVAPAAQAPARGPRVALTFDDLPDHGPLPPGLTRAEVARRILAALQARRAPAVYGFINARQLEAHPEDAEVLRLWRGAGFPLGNHTFSHMDLHANTLDAFEHDLAANETALRTFAGDADWHWFRYPYLREGNAPEKYRAVREMLARRGYRIAQVTLSFDDYAYNDPYARCAARQDKDGLAWLERSYVERAAQSLDRGRESARALVGREVDHVMLLHIGAFETVMLPRLLELLEQHGFTLSTLQEAQADEVYTTVPDFPGPWSGTLLEQMAAARHVTPPPPDGVFEKLAALCRAAAAPPAARPLP
jgi:peptidoglycan/xylan/chitin deacetylase (PgdA/CDA1 family)